MKYKAKISDSWTDIWDAIEYIENIDLTEYSYSWDDYVITDESEEPTEVERRYNFRNVSISVEHANVEVFIRNELDPETQICYIQGESKKEALKEALIITLEYLNHLAEAHENLE
jgi:hypothetical protein